MTAGTTLESAPPPAAGTKNEHGQYFTPAGVADAMVSLLRSSKKSPILEPSSGEGVFLEALARRGFTNVEGVEIDDRLDHGEHFDVHNASFVSWEPESKYSAVIGNPPYIRWKNLASDQQAEVRSHPLWGTLFNSLSDYLTVFIANAIEHLEVGGELVFITPSFWMGTMHSADLREWMLSNGAITDLVVFGESEVFSGVSSAIVIFRFEKGADTKPIRRLTFTGGRRIPEELDFCNPTLFAADEIPGFRPTKHWTVASASEQAAADALEACCARPDAETLFGGVQVSRLGEFTDIANGMVSGLDQAFRFPSEQIPDLLPAELDALLPVAKAKDLVLGHAFRRSHYIDVPSGLDESDFERDFPNFARHMAPFRERLLGRYSYGRDLPYWEWAFRRSERFLRSESPKGFVPCKERITHRPRVRFALVEPGVVATQDMTAFAPKHDTRESIEYIVGYLSTQAVSDWIRIRGLLKGGVAEFSERPLASIPFRWIDWTDADDVELHDQISVEVAKGVAAESFDAAAENIADLFSRAKQRPLP